MNLLTLFLTTIVLLPKQVHEPVIREEVAGLYKIENGAKTNVKLTLHCGMDYEDVKLTMRAGELLTVQIRQPNGYPAACYIVDYKAIGAL
jgi:hypothetical protein